MNISSTLSAPYTNAAEVPQGSTLGHMLPTIFINDIVYSIPDLDKLLHAYDLKIYVLFLSSDLPKTSNLFVPV